MKGIFNTFSSGNTTAPQHAEIQKAVKQTVNQFVKIAESLSTQVPAASHLNLGLLTKIISKQIRENPSQPNSRVTHQINVDGSINFQYLELVYLVSAGMQGIIDHNKTLVEGIITCSSGLIQEGLFAYVPKFNNVYLIKGKQTFSSGNVSEGRFEYIPELNRSSLVEGKLTLSDGAIEEGRFTYSPEYGRPCLLEGKQIFSDGSIYSGQFVYIPELHRAYLAEGKQIFSGGIAYEGRFAYIPELRSIRLIEGQKAFPSGKVESGIFIREPTSNLMCLTTGSVTHPTGKKEIGTFSYVLQLRRNELTNGRTEKGNNWQEGIRNYIPELGRMHLTEGTSHKNGVSKTGSWVYNQNMANGAGGMLFVRAAQVDIPAAQQQTHSDLISTITNITNTFGDSRAVSNLNNLLSTWESLNQTTTPQAYAEKVDQLSEAYHQCKRTLLICAHPDRGGATETAQQYLEPLQKLGRSINNAINPLRNSEPNFV
jgi:hypothetical protein